MQTVILFSSLLSQRCPHGYCVAAFEENNIRQGWIPISPPPTLLFSLQAGRKCIWPSSHPPEVHVLYSPFLFPRPLPGAGQSLLQLRLCFLCPSFSRYSTSPVCQVPIIGVADPILAPQVPKRSLPKPPLAFGLLELTGLLLLLLLLLRS